MAEEQELEADVCPSETGKGKAHSDIPQNRNSTVTPPWEVMYRESLTTSVAESMYAYRQEFGRTYHAYKDGKYIFPNDEREANRLDLQHHLFAKTFGNRLYFAPLHNPRNALDVGTGTGIWAIEFADEFPNCQVVGTDLSPGQPSLIPPNLKFVIDDAEDQWLYETGFDYIHLRLMAGCFSDWQNLFNQAFQNLEPNGWLELQDYGLPVKSADGTADGTDLLLWGELLCEAAKKLGRPMGSDASEMYEKWMRQAGFVDIQQRMFMWPTNGWPKNRYMKELGRWNQVNIMEGLEGFCLALLTRGLGWRKEEVDVFVAKVNRDLANKHIHGYFPMPVTYGRKPYPGEVISNS
ncbi:S-adenosyl-L-methionine-dependent methyltransferase [Dissoconium aciculare CBS 342.82]|uniref:S-adenosyl-L-methionine-dependent methyltransferase n=1 Tax=Dissoconium aciculare CBS 342.82 TaxID=1314786 RepID=A0A6J3M350_9PEZI|nr:S-adenosyl-L-methionine-dependent methyltransferase [Dissoconium aciculare CBS 342.82]KAF1822318.1 S-adenosyl-L-methionine-dependent methyltransferase [Dissoconium aciculare CBS 342.82]